VTFKEWLSRWYHHRGTPKTVVAASLKFTLQFLLWVVVLGTCMVAAFALPFPLLPVSELISRPAALLLGSAALSFTAAEFCMLTLPASEIQPQPPD
jgi:hypothetical protein